MELPRSDSVTWRINGERLMILGWGRAILMQFAHPLVAQAVADHSAFQDGRFAQLQRLGSTIDAMLALTFGNRAKVQGAGAHINRIHDRIQGTLRTDAGPFKAGTPYSAHDPRLLSWVLATLMESMPLAYELCVAPLSRDEQLRYCQEAHGVGDLLGIPHDMIPRDPEAVRDYIQQQIGSGEIVVTDQARALARDILYPPFQPAYWPIARIMRLMTAGTLDPRLRAAYGLRWNDGEARALARWTRLVRGVRKMSPTVLSRWTASRRNA